MSLEETTISQIELTTSEKEFSMNDNVKINVKFSIKGLLRDAFNEKNWTNAYNKNDNLFKLKYGVKLTTGSFRKRSIGKPIDTYRKASIFWTRNPKLVNPMKERRIWVQVSKNFEPFIRLTEEEVRQELFDFDETISFKASELGAGMHKIGGDVFVSWQKHDYIEPFSRKEQTQEIEIRIN